MSPDLAAPETAGTGMARAARRIAEARAVHPAWLAPLERVLERVSDLVVPATRRYDRYEPPPARLPRDPLGGEGEPLAGDVRLRLRGLVGPAADAVRTHTGDAADAAARASRADAVTVGRDILFRRGRLDPRSDAGLALLVHEVTHVSESLRAGAPARRATATGIRAEEALAQRRERAYLRQLRAPAPSRIAAPAASAPTPAPAVAGVGVGTAAAGPPLPAAVQGVAHATAARPMAAPEDRPLAAERVPAAPDIDLASLQRRLYQGLRAEIRAEFERGG